MPNASVTDDRHGGAHVVDSTSPDTDYGRVVAIALAVLCLVAVGVAGATSNAVYDPFNLGWNGTSSMWIGLETGGTDTGVAADPERYRDLPSEGTVVVVLSPMAAYEQPTVDALRTFVSNGGTLLVAEDFRPHSNHLLAGIGATMRFDGAPLRDGVADPSTQPVVSTESGMEVRLNRPTAVDPGDGRPLVHSSAFSYLDTDRDDTLDADESLGRYAVVVSEPVGSGRVVAIGDPSVFINGMRLQAENRAYPRELFGTYDRVVYSSPPGRGLPPVVMAYQAVRHSSAVQFAIGTAGLAAIAFANRTRRGDRTARRIVTRILQRFEPSRDDE